MAEILAATYSPHTTSMTKDADLAARAIVLWQMFFGELIYSSMMGQGSRALEYVRGQEPLMGWRIAVVTPIAITMAVLLFCMAIVMGYMIWANRRGVVLAP